MHIALLCSRNHPVRHPAVFVLFIVLMHSFSFGPELFPKAVFVGVPDVSLERWHMGLAILDDLLGLSY